MRVTGVSYSSDRKLARCEQQYSYRYDEHLKPRIKKVGLFMGSWMHELQEVYRRRQVSWEERWKELKKLKWDKLFDEEKEMYSEPYGTEFPTHCYNLMDHYVEHWGGRDSVWKTVEIERPYELMTKLGFPIRWKSDYIVKEGKITILVETKNKKKIPESEERIMAPQTHGYCFLLSKVGIKIDKILWDYVRTEPVPRPQIKKDGSLSERKINTDQRGYLLSLKEAGIHPKSEADIIGLNNKLKTLPETLTLYRITNTPNLKVGELFVRDWVERARRALAIKRPLRTYTRSCKWECDYLQLCQVDMLGKTDRELEIKKNFVRTSDIKGAD